MDQITSLTGSPHLTALRSTFLVASHHGVQVPSELLGHTNPNDDPAVSILGVMREVGLTARLLRNRSWRCISHLGSAYPVIAERSDGTWLIVACVMPGDDGTGVLAVLDPATEQSGVTMLPRAQFEELWTGRLILSKRKHRLTDERRPFGLGWFAPEILRNARFLRDVGIAAMMSNAISLVVPLLFNVMIDKVVPHRSYHTLVAIGLVFGVTLVFDSVFSYVRQSLMILTSNRIDARLAARTFAHLLSLPLQFFESVPSGVLLRDMYQTETIRHFLTGRLFQTLLDASALPLLLVGLAMYSTRLTVLVLVFSMSIAGVIALLIPVFRRELERLYQAEGERQADLVETLHGMRAIKSLALEQIRRTTWDLKVAETARRRATVGNIGAVANVLTSGLERLMQISILVAGVVEVFSGHLTVGGLVAFNMLSGRVTGPLVQIVALINEYQQTSLAVKMLGRVMDHPPERNPNERGSKPRVSGRLEFQNVRFRYEGSATPALNDISFTIKEGEFIGVVGRSGSGKTTLTRLIQGIQTAQEGLIRLDGYDIRHLDLTHLRRAIGVVLQDNVLFRGTIYNNIAAANSTATLDEVMEAARLAGVNEFIERLPGSYGTVIEEDAANLSGGQRQRIAIARALLTKPRLLLFDEATSALDPESEAIIQQNLAEIASGRTMIVVSHRLSALVHADAILVLDHGEIADYAPHQLLLERCTIYRHLWDQQTRYLK